MYANHRYYIQPRNQPVSLLDSRRVDQQINPLEDQQVQAVPE
jgi:hypothetical protein